MFMPWMYPNTMINASHGIIEKWIFEDDDEYRIADMEAESYTEEAIVDLRVRNVASAHLRAHADQSWKVRRFGRVK